MQGLRPLLEYAVQESAFTVRTYFYNLLQYNTIGLSYGTRLVRHRASEDENVRVYRNSEQVGRMQNDCTRENTKQNGKTTVFNNCERILLGRWRAAVHRAVHAVV